MIYPVDETAGGRTGSSALYPQLYLKDLDGLSTLLLERIGFWSKIHRNKTPNRKYLLMPEEESYSETGTNSEYPMFSSSYFVRRGQTIPGRVNIEFADPECHVDYYLVRLNSEKARHEKLFQRIHEDTII